MNILQNNPYRILGVYSNSPTKERLANHNRMKAFLKVGKAVSFPLDLPKFLSEVNRTEASVAEAEAKLALPKDQLLYAQFWFLKATSLDDMVFKHLAAGDMNKAETIWQKRECASSLQNLVVCALIRKDYAKAFQYAEVLYGKYEQQFTASVIGSSSATGTSLAFDFLDTFCDEVGVNAILPYINKVEWKKHVSEKAVRPLIDRLQDAVTTAQASKGKGHTARLKAGTTLMSKGKPLLEQLGKLLPKTDLQYQTIADKFGLEVLQCCIDYFNDSDDDDAAFKAKKLQSYALSVVVGKMAKDRCKENVDILNGIIAAMPPKEVMAEDKAIKEELRKYCALPDKICHAITLLNNTKPHLQTIKRKLGATNAYYLKISTQVVGNALVNVIAEVNEAQAIFNDDRRNHDAALIAIMGMPHMKSVLREAWKATRIMDGFDMEADFKIKRYDQNRSILKGLCDQFESVPTTLPTSSRYSPSNTSDDSFLGCLWVVIMMIIIGIAYLFFS